MLYDRYRWIIVLTLLSLGSRLLFLGTCLEDWDSVDFALALKSYNIKTYQPHFPGYPVYIFCSWLCDRLLHDPVTSVILPGALLGALTIIPLYGLAQRLADQRIAILTALLYLVNPACWLQAEKAFSDASGLFTVVGALYLCWRASERDARPYHLFYGSLFLGVGLGIRLSYAPLVLSWAGLLLYLAWRQPRACAARCSDGCYGLLIGICLWLAPQLALSGGLELLYDGLAFTSQHFTEWGGTFVSAAALEHRQLGYRLTMFFWGLWAYGLGGWWVDTSLATPRAVAGHAHRFRPVLAASSLGKKSRLLAALCDSLRSLDVCGAACRPAPPSLTTHARTAHHAGCGISALAASCEPVRRHRLCAAAGGTWRAINTAGHHPSSDATASPPGTAVHSGAL